MKHRASNNHSDPGEGPSTTKVNRNDERRYTSKIQSSAHGFEYQKEVAMVLLLRATLRNVKFQLAYEMTDAGPFDDVVFIDEDNQKCLLFQMKHGLPTGNMEPVQMSALFPENAKNRKSGDFSLFKYFKSYHCNLPDLPKEKCFIIFTNKQFEESETLLKKITIENEHIKPESILYFNNLSDKPRKIKPNTEVAEDMVNYVKAELVNLKGATSEQLLENVYDFFNNLVLYCNQPNELKEIIRKEYLGWIRSWMHPVQSGKTDDEENFSNFCKQLVKCLEPDRVNGKQLDTKAFLTSKDVKNCLDKIQNHLRQKNKLLNYDDSALAKVEKYYIGRRVKAAGFYREYEFCEFLTSSKDDLIVLIAQPGMGKSVLFHHASFKIQKTSDDLVFLIYLNNLLNSLKDISSDANEGFEKTRSILASVVFRTNLDIIKRPNGKQIRIFLDGFDEIAPKYEDEVIKMIRTLMKDGIQVIVSGRNHVDCKLRKNFESATFLKLMPFSRQNQIDFLKRKWNISVENDSKFNNYYTQMLHQFDSCVQNPFMNNEDFFENPLMINMLADVKLDEFVEYKKAQDTGALRSLSVTKLYGEFIKKSLDLKLKKMQASDCSGYESMKEVILNHQLLAVHQLDCIDNCASLNTQHMKSKYDLYVEKIKNGKDRSPLVECINGEAQLIHRSFAEYMVAKYLYDNIEESKTFFAKERENIIWKFLLNMIEDQGNQVHFKTIVEMCKFQNSDWLKYIFMEGCLRIAQNVIENSLPIVNNYYSDVAEYWSYQKLYQPIHFAAMNGHEKIVHMLIKKGANINAQSRTGETPLHLVIKHERMVQLLLSYSVNINAEDDDKRTPLHRAIENNQTEIAKMLIEHQIDENKIIAVKYAATFGKISIFRHILNEMVYSKSQGDFERNYIDECKNELDRLALLSPEKVAVNFEDLDGKTPLHYAAETTQLELVKLLVAKSNSLNLKDNHGKMPLHYAAEKGEQDIVDLLLEKTENPYLQDFKGKTPLHYAAEAGHHHIVELLLEKTKHFNYRDIDNNTPLDCASVKGHHKIVGLFLGKMREEDLQYIDEDYLHYAARAGHLEICKWLLKKTQDVDVDVEDGHRGRTPLHYAAEAGHNEFVSFLLDKSAIVHLIDKYRDSAIDCAYKSGHLNIVRLIVEKSFDKGLNKIGGIPILHQAVRAGAEEIVMTLLNTTKDFDEADINGWTPLDYAFKGDNCKIVEMLVRKFIDRGLLDLNLKTKALCHAAKAGHLDFVELMLEHTEGIVVENDEGITPLHCAAEVGHKDIVDLFLKKSEYLNKKYKSQKTPLHYAAEGGHEKIVESLIEKLADINIQDGEGKTPLHYAAEEGHEQIINSLIRISADVFARHVNLPDNYKKTPLHYAAGGGHAKIVESLVNKSAEVNVQDDKGKTPLHYAAEGGHEQIINLLIDMSANVNLIDNDRQTPLLIAAKASKHQAVQLLFDKSNVENIRDTKRGTFFIGIVCSKETNIQNVQDLEGKIALLCVSEGDPNEIVKLMVNSDNVFLHDKNGRTSLHYAAKAGNKFFFELLLRISGNVDVKEMFNKTELHHLVLDKIAEALFGKPADLNVADRDGLTPLHYAVKNGFHEIVELLVKKSANVNLQDRFGETPLHYAVQKWELKIFQYLIQNSVDIIVDSQVTERRPLQNFALHVKVQEIMELLLSKKNDINAKNLKRKALLNYAVDYGSQNIVEFLLDKSADISLKDDKGATPLHYAAKAGCLEIFRLLLPKSDNISVQDNEGKTPLHYAAQMTETKYYQLVQKILNLIDYSDDSTEQLLDATGAGRLKIVELLLNEGENVDSQDNHKKSSLHYAADAGDEKIFELLLNKSLNINMQDSEGKTPLHYAIRRGNVKIVEWLLNKTDDNDVFNIKDSEGRTALHYVANAEFGEESFKHGRYLETLFGLLVHNAKDLNVQDSLSNTPLHFAVLFKAYKTVELLLLRESVNINIQNFRGNTPLHFAVHNKDEKMFEMLLNKSADISIRDSAGKTPLHYALGCKHVGVECGCKKIVELYENRVP